METFQDHVRFEGSVEFIQVPTRRPTKLVGTSPNVFGNEYWKANSNGTIVNFTRGAEGQSLHILGDGSTIVANNTSIKTVTGANETLDAAKVYVFTLFDNVWYEERGGAGGGGSPGGANKQIQFNNAGAFGGDTKLEWDTVNSRVLIGGAFISSLTGLNTNRRLVVGNDVSGYGRAVFVGKPTTDTTSAGGSIEFGISKSDNVYSRLYTITGDVPNASLLTGRHFTVTDNQAAALVLDIDPNGDIIVGSWKASVIGPAYLGTGVRDGTKFLRDDGTWQAVASGGAGCVDKQVQFNDAGVMGGHTGLTYNKTTTLLSVGNIFVGTGYILAGSHSSLNYGRIGITLSSTGPITWTDGSIDSAVEVTLVRSSAGVLEINNGVLGTFRDLKLRNVLAGDWQGSVIAPQYLGTGVRDGTKFLRDDGTWQVVSGGGSLSFPVTLTGSAPGVPGLVVNNTSSTGSGIKAYGASSSMFANTYSYMAANATNTIRMFQFFADEVILQVGQTPATTKWFEPGVNTTAPVGSNGPVKGFAPQSGLLLFGTQGKGDAAIWFINGGNSTSPLTMGVIQSSGDGGLRANGNVYIAPERTSAGTVARTALDVATFDSSATLDDIEVGDSIWVDVGGTIYGYTIRGKLSPTTARLYDGDPGGTWTARSFTIRSSPVANRSKGSIRVGLWDSQFNRFGLSYYQSPLSSYAADTWAMIKDFQFTIYPGGWLTAAEAATYPNGAFTGYCDIGLTGKSRSLRLGTSSTTANDDYRPAITIAPHYTGLPSAGVVKVHSTLVCTGGSDGGATGDRAPLSLVPLNDYGFGEPNGQPAQWNQGDMWITSTTAATPNKLRFIANSRIWEVTATDVGPAT
jgi:hypothetical protein